MTCLSFLIFVVASMIWMHSHNRNLLSVSAYIDVDTKYTAEPFYEKCGFHRIGGPLHPMAECVRMLRYLE